MDETFNYAHREASSQAAGDEDPLAMERRIFRGMCVTVVIAGLSSAAIAPWRVTTGLMIGGVLSLINQHWLRTSVAAAFDSTAVGLRPKLKVARYVLRYMVAIAVVAATHLLDLASLPAMLTGMCSFAAAALLEGFMQLYFAIIRRDET